VQGFGGGFLFALSYTMIRIVFEESLWPRAIGLVSAMWGIATLIGPAIGGVFAELGVWRAAFWSMLPITVLFALLAVAVLPTKNDTTRKTSRLPVIQLALLALSVLAVSMGSVRPDPRWNVVGMAMALLLLTALVLVERRTGHRLLPRGSLNLTAPLGLLFVTMSLLAITVTSSEIFAPLFLQVLHDQSPLVAGYLAVSMSAGWTIGSVSSSGARGRNIDRAIVLAPALCLTGMVLLAALVPGRSQGDWLSLAVICAAFVVVGLGVGIGWPHLLTRVLQVAPADEQELASGAITVVQLFATALGAAVAGTVTNLAGLIEPGGVAGTSSAAFWLFAVFAVAPALGLFSAMRCARLRSATP
jgi:MFS family permease